MKKAFHWLLVILVAGCAAPTPQKSALELQAIQMKEFETDLKVAFASTLSVFQDLGYIVSAASMETGLITAKSPTRQGFVPFVGLQMQDTKATAFIEQISPKRTKIRLNFVNSSRTSSGYGQSGERERPIEEPGPYQDAFTKIQQAIFIRSNTN